MHGDDPERCCGEGGGRGGSCLGTHVRIKDFKIKKINYTFIIKNNPITLKFDLKSKCNFPVFIIDNFIYFLFK